MSMQLPMAAPVAPAAPAPTQEFLRAVRRVKLLSWISLAWMGAEGTIAIVAGILAGSIALVGFGIDSAIEGFASAIIIWRFTGRADALGTRPSSARRSWWRSSSSCSPRTSPSRPCRHLVAGERPRHELARHSAHRARA